MALDPDAMTGDGWKAITTALARVRGRDAKDFHVASVLHASIGGTEWLQGMSAFRVSSPRVHWQYVSFGMSELYEKEGEDRERSGWGFEFTLRVADESASPPSWPFHLMQNLARYVNHSGNAFDVGHHMKLNGPIALGMDTLLVHAGFVRDSEFGTIDTPNGTLGFLQIVGLTADEAGLINAWDAERVLAELGAIDPLHIIDLGRASMLSDPARAERLRAFADREGSTTSALFVKTIDWAVRDGALELTVAANSIQEIAVMLKGRLAHDRTLVLAGEARAVLLAPNDSLGWRGHDGDELELDLPVALARAIAERLEPKRGVLVFEGWPALTVRVVPSTITDSHGKVIREVG